MSIKMEYFLSSNCHKCFNVFQSPPRASFSVVVRWLESIKGNFIRFPFREKSPPALNPFIPQKSDDEFRRADDSVLQQIPVPSSNTKPPIPALASWESILTRRRAAS